MKYEKYVYNERYDPWIGQWISTERASDIARKSEEQKFRDQEMKIIFNQHLQDIEIYGLDKSKIKLNENIKLMNIKVKLWKDRRNEYTNSN